MNDNSANGLRTFVWGPPAWIFLHSVTFGYPQDPDAFDKKHNYPRGSTKKRYHQFFKDIKWILPCKICRDNYEKNLKAIPIEPHLKSRKALTRWLWRFHHRVNCHLKKRCKKVPFSKVECLYESCRAKCKHLTKKEKKIKGSKTGCVVPVGNKKMTCKVKIIQEKK